ncbi:DEAD/DEAH box helicase [Mycolicibacterium acapulense]|nr:DEAD/DEAH box helicase [Mycolicibacterium acapulense]
MTDRLDPLATANQIEATYKRYLKTLLAPADLAMADAFDEAINETRLLTKGPLLELTPPYETGATLQELIDEGVLHSGFSRLDSPAVPLTRPLYLHQEKAIRKFIAGRNLVVSTGTGSGKTESFLLPILDSLIRESAAGTLGPGVRALLLYPMNALANDQLKRLRAALRVAPDITFGRYTGETLEKASDAESDFLASNVGEQRLPNELLSRQEMRSTPPHILLTNYAMLEYLLLRPADIDLFDGPHSGTWRFLVLDEAHVYDGAQGSEVALLLRRLRQRVAPDTNLQCVATSASLEGSSPDAAPSEAMTFARSLFNAKFEFVNGDIQRQDLVKPTRQQRRAKPTWQMTDEQLLRLGMPDADVTDLSRLGGGTPSEALHAERTIADLKGALAAGPVAADVLQRRLWPEDPDSSRKLESLVALGSQVCDEAGNPVLSARYHMFVRATEGAFVSFAPDGPRIFLGRHEIDPETGRAVFEFGTCQRCGAVHLAGDIEHRDGREYFLPSTKNDASVKWLVLTDGGDDTVIDEDEMTLANDDSKADPTIRYLCTGCGLLADSGAAGCAAASCPGGDMRRVREHRAATRVMSRCTECGAQARQVIRRLRTDTNAAPAVITTALYQELPVATDEAAEEVGSGRKLLMFSDSRQAAAFAAPYLDRTYGRFLERRYIVQALQDPKYSDEPLTVEDIAIVTRKKASNAGHFPDGMGSIAKNKAVNEWAIGELMALDTRQSLEGLGLMRVTLMRPRGAVLPRAFSTLGLTEDEAWSLLDELVKTARLQGAMDLLDDVDIQSERFEPRNARIRMRSRGSDRQRKIISWLPSGPGRTNGRMTFVQKVLTALGSSESAEKVLEGCWNYLEQQKFFVVESDRNRGPVFQVDHTKLLVQSGLDCTWYLCDKCRKLTAFNVRGVCPNSSCAGKLHSYAVPPSDADTNHYRVTYQTMGTAPLAAREHTAQWDAKQAAQIQRDFIDGRVNVLSCSTTFELGVDVGDLQSVVMRNMPPKTANYVQRAGRAGRRAASAALVLTYANRASHDLAKYQYPESMIAGQMRIPWVPVDNARIARRHAHSVSLAAYFRHCAGQGMTWRHAGEFFSPTSDGQDSPASRIRQFLTPVPPELKSAVRVAIPEQVHAEIGVEDDSWVERLVDLLAKVEQEVRDDIKTFNDLIDAAIREKNLRHGDRLQKTLATIEKRPLIGFLANKNVLPKYGFPVDTVELRTLHCAEPVGRNLDLARDLSLAIYDYAPGNEVVAGGKVWTSRGLRRMPGRELDERKYRVCLSCKRFQCARELGAGELCPICGEPFGRIRRLVLPEFGFVADRQARDVGTAPPERRWHGASYVEDVGDEVDTYRWSGASDTAVAARAGTRATLAVISEGEGNGFQVCQWCGWADAAVRGARRRAHQRPESGKECDGPLEVVCLGHRYQSDVAEFTFDGVEYQRASESNWLSALYAMLEGASEALEISRDDIDGALSWTKDNRRSIVLFDTVPGGAGAAKRIAENLELVLRSAVDRVQQCDCGPETSCYGCLRSFRNARVHDELSRDGAQAIFGPLGLDGVRSEMSEEWGGQVDLASDAVKLLLAELARRGVDEPEVGIEMGEYYWPVEAVWPNQRIVIVDGADAERDRSLESDGYSVYHASAAEVTQICRALTGASVAS